MGNGKWTEIVKRFHSSYIHTQTHTHTNTHFNTSKMVSTMPGYHWQVRTCLRSRYPIDQQPSGNYYLFMSHKLQSKTTYSEFRCRSEPIYRYQNTCLHIGFSFPAILVCNSHPTDEKCLASISTAMNEFTTVPVK